MKNDINNLDPNDEGLKGIFGDRFHDETEPKPKKKPVEQVPQIYKLKSAAKSALLYGGLSLLFFYWQQTGQMAPTAAMPCICACCILAGLGVGKNVR